MLWSIPPDPEIPAELHGAKVVIVAGLYAGAPGDAAAALAPLAGLGTPLMDISATVNYLDAQSALDAAFPAGGRYFFKSHFLDELTDQAIETMLACDARRPNPESLIVIRTLGGAIARVAGDDSAYPHRDAQYNLSIDAGWFDPALDAAAIGWAPLVVGRDGAVRHRRGVHQLRRPRRRSRPRGGVRLGRRAPRTASRRPTTPTASSPPPRPDLLTAAADRP